AAAVERDRGNLTESNREAAMKTVLTAQVGADGILKLAVPLGATDANRVVRVIVEPIDQATAPIADDTAWKKFVTQMAGKITDPTFVRPPQGEYEQRDELP